MKKLFALILPLLFLTACPKDKEVAIMMDELSSKKLDAEKVIDNQNWDLQNLLTAHDYFFNFSERVLLLKEDADASKKIQKYVKKIGAKSFCQSFVIGISQWQILENYCSGKQPYKCSPEIQEFPNIREKLFQALDTETINLIKAESECI